MGSNNGFVLCGGFAALSGVLAFPSYAHADNDIGIIKGSQGCPPGAQEIEFLLDNEDSGNDNKHDGWIGGITRGDNTHLRFCRVDGDDFFASGPQGTFAVLSLDDYCPENTLRFFRSVDDEDRRNINRVRSMPKEPKSVLPNVSSKNTLLAFCMSQGAYGSANFPDYSVEYGVFATSAGLPWLSSGSYGSIFMDDENNNNADQFSYDWTSDPFNIDAQTARTIIAPEGEKLITVCGPSLSCFQYDPYWGYQPCLPGQLNCHCQNQCWQEVNYIDGKNTILNVAGINR